MVAATERVRHYDPFSAFISDAVAASAAMDGSVAHKVNLTLTLTGWQIQQGVDINWSDGTDEQQTLTKGGTWSGGTYTITVGTGLGAYTTTALAYNANAATIQAALEALASVGTGNVTVSGGPLSTTPVVITFTKQLGNKDVPMVSVDVTLVTGTAPTCTPTQTTAGSGATVGNTSTTPSHTYASAVGAKTIYVRGTDAHTVPLDTTAAITVT